MRQGGSFHPRQQIPPETQMTGDWLSWVSFVSESLRCIPRKRIFFSFYLATFGISPSFQRQPQKKIGKIQKTSKLQNLPHDTHFKPDFASLRPFLRFCIHFGKTHALILIRSELPRRFRPGETLGSQSRQIF